MFSYIIAIWTSFKQGLNWPGKSREAGIVKDFWKTPKSQGRVREFGQRILALGHGIFSLQPVLCLYTDI